MRKRMVSLATLLLLFTATVVTAENRAETFSVTPFLGGYTFDGKQHMSTGPVLGLRAGYNVTDRLGVEGLFDYTMSEGTLDDQKFNVYNYSLDLLYHFCPKSKLVPFLMAGYGGITVEPQGGSNFTRGAFNYGAGVKYALTKSMELRGEVRHIVFKTDESLNNVEYGIGLGFLFGGKAAPPPVPPPAPAPAPAPPAPTSSLSVTPVSITTGEAATLSWTSQNATNCDITPGIGPVQSEGSMAIMPVADTTYSLSCNGPGGTSKSTANISVVAPKIVPPTSSLSVTPGSITQGGSAALNWTSENATNCDIQPGIGPVGPQGTKTISPAADTAYTLTCTGSGGTTSSAANLAVVAPPKPEPPPEMLCYKINIVFDTAKSDIKPQYHDELAKLAAFMKEYPNLTGVIEGHTDNVGGNEYNMKLSENRAKSVRNYLVTKLGIEGSRLTATGFGLSKPEADNKTAAGKQTNRRVVANFACVEKKRK